MQPATDNHRQRQQGGCDGGDHGQREQTGHTGGGEEAGHKSQLVIQKVRAGQNEPRPESSHTHCLRSVSPA